MRGRDEIAKLDVGTALVLVGGVITVIGAFLPWLSVETSVLSKTVGGIDGEGALTLVIAATAMALVVRRDWNAATAGAVIALGSLVTLVAIVYLFDPLLAVELLHGERSIVEEWISTEIGLYLTALGGLVLTAGAVSGYWNRSADEPDPASASSGTER